MLLDFLYKGDVDNAILALQESRELDRLKKLWWEQEENDAKCQVII